MQLPQSFSAIPSLRDFSLANFSFGLSRKIGIDLGSSRTRIWTDQDGIVIDEPSCIAVQKSLSKVIAVGQEAQEMVGRVGADVEISYPVDLRNMLEPDLIAAMLKVFLQKVFQTPYFLRPVIMVSVPADISEIERKSLIEVMYGIGAREVYCIQQVLAAAIGAGVPIADASGSFILQVGNSAIEGGIISLGSLIAYESIPYAGQYIDESIQRLLRREQRINVGIRAAEQIKKTVGTALEQRNREMRVTGQDVLDLVPREIAIDSHTIFPCIQTMMEKTIGFTRKLFEKIPAELTSDVIDKGILLTGGFAQLNGLDFALLSLLGVPVSLADEPERAVVRGIAQVLENLELFKESVGYR